MARLATASDRSSGQLSNILQNCCRTQYDTQAQIFDTCQPLSWQSWRMEAEPWQSGWTGSSFLLRLFWNFQWCHLSSCLEVIRSEGWLFAESMESYIYLRSKHLRRIVEKVLELNYTKRFSISITPLLHLLSRIFIIGQSNHYLVQITVFYEFQVYCCIKYISCKSALTIVQSNAKTGNYNFL